MVERPPITEAKYEAILAAALVLFRQYGLRKVTVEEVCRQSAVSKMTFYKAFANKDALIITVLDRLIARAIADFEQMKAHTPSFLERVRALLAMKERQLAELGEPFVRDLADPGEVVAAHLAARQRELEGLSFSLFREAQQEGLVRRDLSPGLLKILLEHNARLFEAPELEAQVPEMRARMNLVLEFFFYGVMQPGERDERR